MITDEQIWLMVSALNPTIGYNEASQSTDESWSVVSESIGISANGPTLMSALNSFYNIIINGHEPTPPSSSNTETPSND